MKTVTVLVPIQLDVENGSVEEVQTAIFNINSLLGRNSYECNDAQILGEGIDNSDISENDFEQDED